VRNPRDNLVISGNIPGSVNTLWLSPHAVFNAECDHSSVLVAQKAARSRGRDEIVASDGHGVVDTHRVRAERSSHLKGKVLNLFLYGGHLCRAKRWAENAKGGNDTMANL
jgi:hypothetical protein